MNEHPPTHEEIVAATLGLTVEEVVEERQALTQYCDALWIENREEILARVRSRFGAQVFLVDHLP